jgi:hypothetical protein
MEPKGYLKIVSNGIGRTTRLEMPAIKTELKGCRIFLFSHITKDSALPEDIDLIFDFILSNLDQIG